MHTKVPAETAQHADQLAGFRGRVLYVARAPFISGAERALVSMLGHLDRGRVEPALVLGRAGPLAELASGLGVPVHIIPLSPRSAATLGPWWLSLWRLRHLLHRFGPDVAHANDVPSCQALSVAAARAGPARVVHVRWGIRAADAAWFARRGAECVICISGWVRDQLGSVAGTAIQGADIAVLPDCVDWPAQAGEVSARRPPAEPTLAFAGQLIAEKGLDLVLEALGRMAPDRRPRLLVAGRDTQTGGRYEAQLRHIADRCGVADRVEWLGFVEDVAALHARATAVVCPSRVEPLGLVPLEAARFGVPAFASRTGGLAETVEDGRTGWLIEPTADAWALALAAVHDQELVDRLGRAAHERTRIEYAPAVYQRRLLAVYQAATRRRGGDRAARSARGPAAPSRRPDR